ncbi:MAG: type I-U CRISPR-associated protein Cas5/Cas6 [Verrucomicrobiales bacterium]|nr:type I-U CRISPR-associated protein Cas5/Cas6 [Verrucomicrobiales bacterium]
MHAIAIRFPAGGRYHATAWGSHVNEGVPEWPPSPWRLLRALIATARWKHGGPTSEDPTRLRPLIEALAKAPPPHYVLPSAAAAHTRHYMPLGGDSTTKVFDTFVQPADGDPLMILWDATLDAAAREYLASLLSRLNYFGRAESLCEAELLPADFAPPPANAFPTAPGEPLGGDQQTLKLLAPMPPAEYTSWLNGRLPAPGKKLTAKELRSLPPPDLFAALQTDTADWRGTGWSQPPGSRWIEYVRPATPFKLAAPPARHVRTTHRGVPGPAVARYEIQAPVRESITKALSLGERLHVALCSRSNASPVFSGRHAGQPLKEHEHAFHLPECDHRGLLVRITVFARMGFDCAAVQALRSLRETWSRRSPGMKLILLGIGPAADFGCVSALGESREWLSLTPFVPVRHIQRSRTGKPRVDAGSGMIRGSPEHDLRRLLLDNGFPTPANIEPLDALQLEGRRIRWANFQRERRSGKGAAITTRSGFGFRLRFDQAVRGPLALGYGAHFGLGLFVPVLEGVRGNVP